MRLKWGLLLLMSIVVAWVVLNHLSTNSEGQSQHAQQQLTQEKKTKGVSNLDIGIPIPLDAQATLLGVEKFNSGQETVVAP